MDTTLHDWYRLREALPDAAGRTAELLRRVPDPAAPGTGTWTAAETGFHLASSLAADFAAAGGPFPDLPPHLLSQVLGVAGATDVADVNAAMLATDPERNLGRLSERIE